MGREKGCTRGTLARYTPQVSWRARQSVRHLPYWLVITSVSWNLKIFSFSTVLPFYNKMIFKCFVLILLDFYWIFFIGKCKGFFYILLTFRYNFPTLFIYTILYRCWQKIFSSQLFTQITHISDLCYSSIYAQMLSDSLLFIIKENISHLFKFFFIIITLYVDLMYIVVKFLTLWHTFLPFKKQHLKRALFAYPYWFRISFFFILIFQHIQRWWVSILERWIKHLKVNSLKL